MWAERTLEARARTLGGVLASALCVSGAMGCGSTVSSDVGSPDAIANGGALDAAADNSASDGGSSDGGASDGGVLDGGPPSAPDAHVDTPTDAEVPPRDTIYVAVGGDDANDGRTPERSVATLDRAQAIVADERPPRPVSVRIGPGDYRCRELGSPWTYASEHRVTIEPLQPVPSPAVDSAEHVNRPRFWGIDGDGAVCPRSVFFSIQHGRVAVNLTVRGIAVRHYRGAISIGNPSALTTRVDQEIVVENVAFIRIGDFYHTRPSGTGVLAGKGAILLTYTYGNRFEDNYFQHIRNGEGTAGLIHAIYFTHAASRHRVIGNVFHGHTGAIIKLTDYSNANVFSANRFSAAPTAIVDRWCGAREDPATSCRDGEAECPSWENVFRLEDNAWSSLAFDEPYVVYPVPSGQRCRYEPARSGVRMDLGSGGMVR